VAEALTFWFAKVLLDLALTIILLLIAFVAWAWLTHEEGKRKG
jgi:hypothetical protein